MKNKLKMRSAEIVLLAAPLMLLFSIGYAQQPPTLSDSEVAHVAVVANQIDIDYAAIAKEKSRDDEILKFALTMANDHTAVIKQAAALAEKLGIKPQDNPVSKQLLDDARKKQKELRSYSGKAFDKAYIDNEVAYHKAVIGAVETLLIPETENSELKDLLKNVVPALNAHLAHAEKIQKRLNNSK